MSEGSCDTSTGIHDDDNNQMITRKLWLRSGFALVFVVSLLSNALRAYREESDFRERVQIASRGTKQHDQETSDRLQLRLSLFLSAALRARIVSTPKEPSNKDHANRTRIRQEPTSLVHRHATEFDYDAYWKAVTAKIQLQEEQQRKQPTQYERWRQERTLSNCPKVFVYNLTDPFFSDEGSDFSQNFTNVFGKPQPPDGLVYMGERMESLSRVLEYRIHTSRYCQTKDPQAADLLWVPLFPRHRPRDMWRDVSCAPPPEEVVQRLLEQLRPHLTEQNACKHAMGFARSFHSIPGCDGWWRNPQNELLQAFMRVGITEHAYKRRPDLLDVGYQADEGLDHSTNYPNHYSVPYISSFHWQRDFPAPYLKRNEQRKQQQQHHERPFTMLFVGSTFHGDLPVRQEIERQCQAYQDSSKCKLEITHELKSVTKAAKKRKRSKRRKATSKVIEIKPTSQKNSLKNTTTNAASIVDFDKKVRMAAMLHQKLEATFCLEPGGDTPDRKSISDSMAAGCIPVFFSNATAVGSWRWFWSDWKDMAHIMVPRRPFVQGKIDLYTLLNTTMPLSLMHHMQATLASNAREFQYSIDEDPHDAVRLMLEGLKRESQRKLNENGHCRIAGHQPSL